MPLTQVSDSAWLCPRQSPFRAVHQRLLHPTTSATTFLRSCFPSRFGVSSESGSPQPSLTLPRTPSSRSGRPSSQPPFGRSQLSSGGGAGQEPRAAAEELARTKGGRLGPGPPGTHPALLPHDVLSPKLKFHPKLSFLQLVQRTLTGHPPGLDV